MFEAYNQWLFGAVENLAAYDSWTKTHTDQFEAFKKFQVTGCSVCRPDSTIR